MFARRRNVETNSVNEFQVRYWMWLCGSVTSIADQRFGYQRDLPSSASMPNPHAACSICEAVLSSLYWACYFAAGQLWHTVFTPSGRRRHRARPTRTGGRTPCCHGIRRDELTSLHEQSHLAHAVRGPGVEHVFCMFCAFVIRFGKSTLYLEL